MESAASTKPADRADRSISERRRSGPGRARRVLRRPGAAAAAIVLVMAGAGTAAANDWLRVFESQHIDVLQVRTSDLVAVPDLSAFGRVVVTRGVDVHGVGDAEAARVETGLEVPVVTALPRGVSGEPGYEVAGAVSVTFTFSAERALESASEAGAAMPPLPPGLDGSQVRLEAGPGVAAVWSRRSGMPSLVVGRAVAPTAFSSGVPFEVMRDHLLNLPGVPDELAEQLRTFTADGSTLPLPVPADQFSTSTADVNGVQARMLATRDRSLAAAIWVVDGLVTVVAGALGSDEVLQVARNLR